MDTETAANSIKILRTEQLRLKHIREGLSTLEQDVRCLSAGELRFILCIDFHDLRRYLSWQPPRTTEGISPSRLAEKYVSVLIFHALPAPLVLVPSYYDEFISYVKALVFDKQNLEGERELWLTKLRRTFTQEILGDDGLLAKLELTCKSELGEDETEAALRDLTGRIDAIISELAEGMTKARRAVAFIERFDKLFQARKLVGLKAVIASGQRFEKDDVYWKALSFLRSKKGGPDKITANENDARALSLLRQLNRHLREKRQVCLLLSGAGLLREAADVLNDDLRVFGERIEVRDLEYWRLWFSCVSSKDEVRESPDIAEVLELRARLEPVLAELETNCLELLEQLRAITKTKTGTAPNKLVTELDSYLLRLRRLLGRIGKPIVDGRWLSAEFERGFLPITGEEEFNRSIAKIRSLLERIRSRGEDVLELKEELENLLVAFQSILAKTESVTQEYYAQVATLGAVFISDWMLRDEEMREPYASLLQTLEYSGVSSANAVIQRCRQLRANKHEGSENNVVMARAFLLQGEIKRARSEYEEVSEADRVRPSVELLGAAILRAEGRITEAEEVLRSLKGRYGGPVISLSLGSVLAARYEPNKDAEVYKEAIQSLREAADEAGQGTRLHQEATAARIRLEMIRESDRGNTQRLLELRDEIEKLRKGIVGNEALAQKVEALQGLIADLVVRDESTERG